MPGEKTERPRWPYLGRRISYREAVALQQAARAKVRERWRGADPRTVAGVDISTRGGQARAAIVVLDFQSLERVAASTAVRPLDFPYIPGLLAFREVPAILEAYEQLTVTPDLLFVDGHGKAHPRRFGVACHVGIELDRPAVGIGKTRFVGDFREPGKRRGSQVQLRHEGEVIGKVVRTRDGVKPIFVSTGHRIDLERAVKYALRATTRYRLPEPIRAAHNVAGGIA